jgi:hypothetical protein
VKSWKTLRVILAAVLIVAGGATADTQAAQQAGDRSQSDANALKDKKNTAAVPAVPKSQGARASVSASTPPASPASTPGSTASAANPAATHPTPPAKSASMVWVNTDSRVYHKRGTRWYGKTKNGKYMTEADAVRAGYKPAKKE